MPLIGPTKNLALPPGKKSRSFAEFTLSKNFRPFAALRVTAKGSG